jgi:hypothetical protein
VFNKYILEARELPILNMLERIRTQLMIRHYSKQKEAEGFVGNFVLRLDPKLLGMLNLPTYASLCLLFMECFKYRLESTPTLLTYLLRPVTAEGGSLLESLAAMQLLV